MQPAQWPIGTIKVEGLKHYTAQQVLAVAGLKTGQMASKADFDAARDRLAACGAFETVGYRSASTPGAPTYSVVIQVLEVEPLYAVKFQEIPELSGFLKTRDPLFGTRIPATKQILDRYAALLTGHVGEKVVGRVVEDHGELVVLFRPARAIPSVAAIQFTGNSLIPDSVLLPAIGGVAVGVPYTEERFRQILDLAIRPLYEARGRVRMSFPKLTTEKAPEVDGLTVTVQVDESAPYQLAAVTMDSHTDLLKPAKFKTEQVANMDEVKESLERVRTELHKQGYLKSEVTAERRFDDAKKQLSLAVHVKEGPRFSMGKLEILGLDLQGEAAIRKLWGMKEGRPFNSLYPEHFLAEVKEQGLFDNLGKTRFTTKLNEAERLVDVALHFR